MKIFDCNQDESSEDLTDYGVEGTHKWNLPGVKCPSCGATWATTGVEYPTVDISDEPFAPEYFEPSPVPLDELERLKSQIRSRFPADVTLLPGTQFGRFSGKASGRFPDFVYANPWTLLIRRHAYDQLLGKGLGMPEAIAPELRLRKNQPHDLLELEIQPLCLLAQESFLPNGDPCGSCGRVGRQVDVPIVSSDSLPVGTDLFRPRNFPTYILGTERFEQAVRELKLTGMVFQELKVI
jgi:uncharacterized double-CXXCG motif protein